MSTTPETTALDKPGAGIPFFERIMAKYFIMPREVRKRSWEDCGALFDREGARIVELIKDLTPAQLEKKVLIDRIPGIEDSSRFWSVKMTLEHLIVVGNGIGKIVGSLAQNTTPTVDVDIAKVKPKGAKPTAETVTVFKSFEQNQVKRVMETVNSPIWLPGPSPARREFCKPEDCHNAHPGNAHNGAGWMLPFNDG